LGILLRQRNYRKKKQKKQKIDGYKFRPEADDFDRYCMLQLTGLDANTAESKWIPPYYSDKNIWFKCQNFS